ncbi:hypothetical protein BJ878DRAFT_499573, partial [Calycina marina]
KRQTKEKDQTTLGGLYGGNKIRHLKKDDGEPLWRKDIQYDFLRLVFENEQAVFTNSYQPEEDNWPRQTFASLYIDAMARSSKTSKILRDKLLTEHEPAKNMAMVCLLVNLGRMNTTLNFFPEMRAQLRTYHAIPSLQARQDPNSYKQLQDAPRLKSILKGASEDRPEPNTTEKIKELDDPPRTNPVNLIFVLAQYSPKITELHFEKGQDFFDLIMRTDISSESRATAFLWLMWFYLESDFTEEGAEENPFGPGIDYGKGVKNQGVPRLKYLTAEEEELENVNTIEEIEYGRGKQRERKRIIEADQAVFQAENGPPKRGPKPKLQLIADEIPSAAQLSKIRANDGGGSPAPLLGKIRPKYESDVDSTRSTPPRGFGLSGMRIHSVLNNGKARNSLKNPMVEGSSPTAVPGPGEGIMRRPRPLTAHQLAVEKNRNQRVDYILSRGLRREHRVAKARRTNTSVFYRCKYRIDSSKDDVFYDSECEENYVRHEGIFQGRGLIGLVQLHEEEDDFGEEVAAYCAAVRRIGRRLDRWDAQMGIKGVVGTNRVLQPQLLAMNGHNNSRDAYASEDEPSLPPEPKLPRDESTKADEQEDLDDMDKELLGLGSGDEERPDEDLDDVEKELLGLGGDDTEDDNTDGMDVD